MPLTYNISFEKSPYHEMISAKVVSLSFTPQIEGKGKLNPDFIGNNWMKVQTQIGLILFTRKEIEDLIKKPIPIGLNFFFMTNYFGLYAWKSHEE